MLRTYPLPFHNSTFVAVFVHNTYAIVMKKYKVKKKIINVWLSSKMLCIVNRKTAHQKREKKRRPDSLQELCYLTISQLVGRWDELKFIMYSTANSLVTSTVVFIRESLNIILILVAFASLAGAVIFSSILKHSTKWIVK